MELSSELLLQLEQKVITLFHPFAETVRFSWNNKSAFPAKQKEQDNSLDILFENQLRPMLMNLFPQAGFIVEFGLNNEASDYNWIIDPIDHTDNYIHMLPLFYLQLALLYKKQPILGVIINPISQQVFSASLGNGTRVNGVTVKNNQEVSLSSAIVDIDFGKGESSNSDWKNSIFKLLSTSAHRVRLSGGTFAPYIVTGSIHAHLSISQEATFFDQAPRIIIAREYGITAEYLPKTGRKKILLMAPKNLYSPIASLVQQSI